MQSIYESGGKYKVRNIHQEVYNYSNFIIFYFFLFSNWPLLDDWPPRMMMITAASKFVAFLVASVATGVQADPASNVCLKTPYGPFRKYATGYVKKFVDQGNLASSLTQSKLKLIRIFQLPCTKSCQ